MVNLREIVKKIVPKKKEDITVRVIVDVAESYKQLFKVIADLKEKDYDRIGSTIKKISNQIDKRIAKL
jgi:biopolymer transport protein ExbD